MQNLKNLALTIILYFVYPDEILGNRDDGLFIDRLKNANKGSTYVVIGNNGGHVGFHPELWKRYKKIVKNSMLA